MQQLMEGLEEAVAAGVSRAFLPPSCDIITQEDHQWEQWIISNVTLFLEQKKCNLRRRKGYLNGVPLQRWEAGFLSAVPAVPLLNSELQEPLALQEKDCRSPFASRSPHGGSGSVSCSWFTCRVCTSVLYLKLQHFSAGAGVKGADPAETGKAHDPEKWFEILKENVKAGAPLSKYIKWEKFSVCDHAKG